MLNVPESIKTLYKTDGINKNFRVHFPNGENVDLTNKDIVEGSVKFTESVSSKDVLKFGLTEQSKIEFECVGVPNIFGVTIECGNEIDISSLTAEEITEIQEGDYEGTLVLEEDSDIGFGYYRIPYGVFTVASCPRQMGAMKHRRVTGYSKSYAELFENNDIFNAVYLTPTISVDTSFFDFLIDKSTYTLTAVGATIRYVEDYDLAPYGCLFNKNKNAVKITVAGEVCDSILYTYTDVVEVNATCDFQAYEANGAKIAEILTMAGVDVTYNKDGKKIYKTNEDALRAVYPAFFYPCITVELAYMGATTDGVLRCCATHIPVKSNMVTTPYGMAGNLNKAIYGTVPANIKKGFDDYASCTQRFIAFARPTNNRITVNVYPSGNPADATGKTSTNYGYDVQLYNYEVESSRAYFAGDALNGSAIILNPSLKSNTYTTYLVLDKSSPSTPSTPTLYSNVSLQTYVYENSISPRSAVISRLELQAKFGSINRHGVAFERQLSHDNSITLHESMLEDLWWDEYNVEKIGKVTYKMGDTNDEVEYEIGSGGSIYEFGDNYFIKRLFNSYEEQYKGLQNVNDFIDENFVPSTEDIPFVPVNLTMIGLPYLEAGDALEMDFASEQLSLTATQENPIQLNVNSSSAREEYDIISTIVEMQPYQASDFPPYAADKGLNHFPFPYVITGSTRIGDVHISIGPSSEYDYNELVTVSAFNTTTTAGYVDVITNTNPIRLKVGRYRLVYPVTSGSLRGIAFRISVFSTKKTYVSSVVGADMLFTVDEDDDDVFVRFSTRNGDTVPSTVGVYYRFLPVLIREGETNVNKYYPYENIVDIERRLSASINKTTSDGTTETFTIQFPETAGEVYGGSVDFVNGVLESTYLKISSYNGEDIPDHWYSDRDAWENVGDKPSIGATVVYRNTDTSLVSTDTASVTLSEGVNTLIPSVQTDTLRMDVIRESGIGTYMLNRELSGVQTLFDEVEANGGEVLG